MIKMVKRSQFAVNDVMQEIYLATFWAKSHFM